jgi:hypothetical protein
MQSGHCVANRHQTIRQRFGSETRNAYVRGPYVPAKKQGVTSVKGK